ncbi:MAG TPA: macro domain-containing protein [Verrucomicrobiae bacterium]|nr:macro domain-containing protein [Verrucomicrobiae bacterium]
MRLHFVDDNTEVVKALQATFKVHPEVEVTNGDLLKLARNCIVSPANSQGFMDGGIDKAFVTFFGSEIEARVRTAIGRRPEGRLPVGSSLVINTVHAVIPFLLVAPTMESPEMVEAVNAYRAMRAILRIATAHEEIGRAVYCPGLCTGVGGVLPSDAANQMLRTYEDWKGTQPTGRWTH